MTKLEQAIMEKIRNDIWKIWSDTLSEGGLSEVIMLAGAELLREMVILYFAYNPGVSWTSFEVIQKIETIGMEQVEP